ncbi:hypothetical protein RF11_01681 [Thelohanellus kitauei]|uniref:Uncharacterized protein n=1 Tax=Thelohanellus kitauei TaxID=669202 RepID=A0A0C2MC08_THEKT|nr:hypothetical protein RF11_01681 [Thelohanellus kitauei]
MQFKIKGLIRKKRNESQVRTSSMRFLNKFDMNPNLKKNSLFPKIFQTSIKKIEDSYDYIRDDVVVNKIFGYLKPSSFKPLLQSQKMYTHTAKGRYFDIYHYFRYLHF